MKRWQTASHRHTYSSVSVRQTILSRWINNQSGRLAGSSQKDALAHTVHTNDSRLSQHLLRITQRTHTHTHMRISLIKIIIIIYWTNERRSEVENEKSKCVRGTRCVWDAGIGRQAGNLCMAWASKEQRQTFPQTFCALLSFQFRHIAVWVFYSSRHRAQRHEEKHKL